MTTQERIVIFLREKSGSLIDAYDAAERIGAELDVPADRVEAAFRALENRGFITRENKRTVALTEFGWMNEVAAPAPDDHPAVNTQTPERTLPTATPLAVVPEPAQREVSKPHPTKPHPTKERVMGKESLKDRIVAELGRRGGRVDDLDGKCVAILARAVDAKPDTVAFALQGLVAKGTIVKNSKPRIGTTSIALTNGKAASNGDGQVPIVSGRDRVGNDGERKAGAARRKAGAPSRPAARVRRGGPAGEGKRAPSRRRGRADGDGPRVDEPLRDVPVRGAASEVEAELAAIRAVVDLPPPSRQRVVAFIASAFAEVAES